MSEKIYKARNSDFCAEFLDRSAKEGKKALFIAHRSPDGDAVGSAFALKLIYESLGGSCNCACCDKIPEYLRFLLPDGTEFIKEDIDSYDLMIAVDVASPSQLGGLEHLAEKTELCIDHHENHTPFCDSYRVNDASAAGELVFKIYRSLVNNGKIKENTDICRLIYTAISTDSGSFRYSNTTKETHLIAAELTEAINSEKFGKNTAEISMMLHDQKSLQEIKAQGMCIELLKIREEGKIAYIILDKEEMEKRGLGEEDFGSAIEIPRKIKGVEIAFTVKEQKGIENSNKKIYRISARSNTDASVAEICSKYGGGGHAKAAGASVEAENGEMAAEIMCNEFKSAIRS